MLVMPLDSVSTVSSLTEGIVSMARNASAALGNVGIGIGSILVLIAVFRSVAAILDGSRFQIKMLVPVLLYILVCNFSVVADVAIYLTGTVTRQSVDACNKTYSSALGNRTWMEAMWDEMNKGADHGREELERQIREYEEEDREYKKAVEESDDSASSTFVGRIFGKAGQAISLQIKKWWDQFRYGAYNKLMLATSKVRQYNLGSLIFTYGLPMLAVAILEWIGRIVQYVVCCIGAVGIGVIVAFGPITWSFAILPGNGRVVLSWFIRLLQFSLYAPIVALVNAFTFQIMTDYCFKISELNATGGASGGFFSPLIMLVVLVANLVCLTAVPTLSSMIIEGASGQISFSQGLQVMTSPVRSVMNYASMGSQMHESKRDESQLDVLKQIRDGLVGNGSNGLVGNGFGGGGSNGPSGPGSGGGTSGQNSGGGSFGGSGGGGGAPTAGGGGSTAGGAAKTAAKVIV